LDQLERRRVDAIAQTGWLLRGVVEDVTEVGVALAAKDFRPRSKQLAVLFLGDVLCDRRLIEAGPTGPRFEFRLRVEQRLSAADAGIDAILMPIRILPGSGSRGPRLGRRVVVLVGERFAPL